MNLVTLYQVFENDNFIYLVMEQVDNGELFDFIVKNRKLSESEACKIYAQLIEAL